MMPKFLYLVLLILPSHAWSQETSREQIHAVINSDGSISFFSTTYEHGFSTLNEQETTAFAAPDFGFNVIPIPEEEFMANIGATMFNQAISLACELDVLPKEISVSASIGASFGVFVIGQGTISFNTTWDTAQLCGR